MNEGLKSIQLIERLLLVTAFAIASLAFAPDHVSHLRLARTEISDVIRFRQALIASVRGMDWSRFDPLVDQWFDSANERSWEYPPPMMPTGRRVQFNLRSFNGVAVMYALPYLSRERTLAQLARSPTRGTFVVPERRHFTAFVEGLLPRGMRCQPCLINMAWLTPSPGLSSAPVSGSRMIHIVDVVPDVDSLREEWGLEGGISLGSNTKACTVDRLRGCVSYTRHLFTGSDTWLDGSEKVRFSPEVERLSTEVEGLPRTRTILAEYGALTPEEALAVLDDRIGESSRQLSLFGVVIDLNWASVFGPLSLIGLLMYFTMHVRSISTGVARADGAELETGSTPILMKGWLPLAVELATLVVLPVSAATALWLRLRALVPLKFSIAGAVLALLVAASAASAMSAALRWRHLTQSRRMTGS